MPQKDLIVLGRITATEDAAALGHQRRDEKYELEVIISSQRNTTSQTEVDTKAASMMAELEAQLRTDPLVGGCGVQWAVFAGFEATPRFSGLQKEAEIVCRVSCLARI